MERLKNSERRVKNKHKSHQKAINAWRYVHCPWIVGKIFRIEVPESTRSPLDGTQKKPSGDLPEGLKKLKGYQA
jgi:hypothetical protein